MQDVSIEKRQKVAGDLKKISEKYYTDMWLFLKNCTDDVK